MLVNYYYECIRSHDSKPWSQLIGISRKKNDEKKPAAEQVFFFDGSQTAGAKAVPIIPATADIAGARLRAVNARDRKHRATRLRRSCCCGQCRRPGAMLRSNQARLREARSRRA